MKYEVFAELFNELDSESKINLFNEYASEYRPDDQLFIFDDDFLNTYFSDPASCARALFFGSVNNWCDEYIRFNGYGNLESLSIYEAESYVEDYKEEIYDYPAIWCNYIDDDDETDDDQ